MTAALCNRFATRLRRAFHPMYRHLRYFSGSPPILGVLLNEAEKWEFQSYVKSISSSRSLSCSSNDSCEAERTAGSMTRVKFPAKRASVPAIRCMFPSQRGCYSPFHLCPRLWCPPWTSYVYRMAACLSRRGPARWPQVRRKCVQFAHLAALLADQ
jgi:hypothetical protein